MASDTRARILDASRTLFQRQGYARIGIRQIFAQTGAAFASLYHFFPCGKDQLVAEAIRTSGAMCQHRVGGVFDAPPDLLAGIRTWLPEQPGRLSPPLCRRLPDRHGRARGREHRREQLRQARAGVFANWIMAATADWWRPASTSEPPETCPCRPSLLLEGAFVLSRAVRGTEPMRVAGKTVTDATRTALGASRRLPTASGSWLPPGWQTVDGCGWLRRPTGKNEKVPPRMHRVIR